MSNPCLFPITIHTAFGCSRNIVRVVHKMKPTGHTPKTWDGITMYQWRGVVKYNGKLVDVWGYTKDLYPAVPTQWTDGL